MGSIVAARAYANNEVAYPAWAVDGKIDGCRGFEVVRGYLDAAGNVAKTRDGKDDRVTCAARIAFKGQRNPHWLPQTTRIWPVQKLSWRDLTLRQRRHRAGGGRTRCMSATRSDRWAIAGRACHRPPIRRRRPSG